MLMFYKNGGVKIKSILRSYIVVLPSLLLVVSSSIGSASAASGSTVTAGATPGASGLSISPLRNEISLSPGKTTFVTLTLKNITGGPITAEGSVLDFVSDGSTGSPRIITNDSQFNDPASIKKFVSGVNSINLAAGQQKTVNIPVQAPAEATPGAYYGLVDYKAVPQAGSADNAAGNSKVSLSAAVGSLIFITIPGNVTEIMQVTALHFYSNIEGTSESVIFTKPPKAAGVGLNNLGNAFEKPFGTVVLQNIHGKTIYSYQLNNSTTRGIVLPYSTRVFKNALSNIKTPGPYTLIANISYGKGSSILIGKKTFWYLPVWLIVIIVLILLVLVLALTFAFRKYKKVFNGKYKK
jgi:hypothetical protein